MFTLQPGWLWRGSPEEPAGKDLSHDPMASLPPAQREAARPRLVQRSRRRLVIPRDPPRLPGRWHPVSHIGLALDFPKTGGGQDALGH